MSVLDPFTHALAAVLAAAHTVATNAGLAPDAGLTWVLCIAALVVGVRLLLLPLVVHGVRAAHTSARMRPHLKALADRHRTALDARDPEAMRVFMEQRRALAREHGASRLGCLPVLLQLPVWIGLFHLISGAASGATTGAMDASLVASLGAATIAGVPLADRGYVGAGPGHLMVVAGLALTAALLSYVTQRFFVLPNTVLTDVPEAMAQVQGLLPGLSAVGILVAGGIVPVALLVYWVCNNAWTLTQSVVVWRWFPTPGSPAALRVTPT